MMALHFTKLFKKLILSFVGILTVQQLSAQSLIHYWNFNTTTSEASLLSVNTSLIAGAGITAMNAGSSVIDVAGGTGQNFNVLNLNSRNGAASGTHLRYNNPIGGQLEFALPTTQYKDIVVKFSTRRSGSGAGVQNWSYTIDGQNYTPFTSLTILDADPELKELNFTNTTGVNNNPLFKLRVSFSGGAGGLVGNNRFDNFSVDATLIGVVDQTPPVATIAPIDNASNLNINTQPYITFNEPVRLINNAAINNTNAASLVTLRLNNATGATVPFTSTFINDTLHVLPINPLLNNQTYYVALLPNTIEDLHDNALSITTASSFTTMPLQTVFEAGDMVCVAYRMNATGAEDEIALLTFKDILPGTFINITDGKYTTNTQAQCSGGLVWTAPLQECVPAGSIITIQTSATIANIGTVTGSGFGLSSSGDQVIVYTGSVNAPQYITAITANNWVTTNTNCGGSESMLPLGLLDGVNALNMSTAPGNVNGLSVNAYYNGIQTGSASVLRTAILNPANWIVAPGATAPQTWPGYYFPSAPTVLQATVLNNTSIQLAFNCDLNTTIASNINNYTGIAGISNVSVTNNGTLVDTVTLTFSTPFVLNNTYTLSVQNLESTLGMSMACTYNYNFQYKTSVVISKNFFVTKENAGVFYLEFPINYPSASTLDIALMPNSWNTADANDFTLNNTSIAMESTANTIQIPITIIDDAIAEQDAEYFTMMLHSTATCGIEGDSLITVYIKDNDVVVPQPTQSIALNYVGSFDPSGEHNSTCEIVTYDKNSKRLFTTSAVTNKLDIIDFSNPLSLQVIHTIDMDPYGGITSVAVHSGLVAVASPNIDESQDGSVVFFDIDGNFIKQVTVGALPDMVTFSPDGNWVLTANEGQPPYDYNIDPEGSVSLIDLSNGINTLTQAQVTTLYFTDYNSQEAALIASGIRKTKASSTLSQDLEPEYVTVSSDSKKAWVTLQENNAIAEISLEQKSIVDLWALGTKNMNTTGAGFDASDNNDSILIANWPVKTFYSPDGIANYTSGNQQYLIIANEGDEKEYNGLNERTTVGANNYNLDSAAFPNAAMLKKSYNLGRFRVTNLHGDVDGDGDYDEIYAIGARSFSIFNAQTQSIVYDSGDDFERFIAHTPAYASIFNADNENNNLKARSRAKGPEPEGITTAQLSNKQYAFIGLERVGGIMVYDVTNPNDVKFVDYNNTRTVSAYGGDLGPEGMVFIPAAHTTTAHNYLVVANEISGTLTVYEVVDNNIVGLTDVTKKSTTFNVFPNPSTGLVYFNRKASVQVFDAIGKLVYQEKDAYTLNTLAWQTGTYWIVTDDGARIQLVVTN
jgi:hypothetical protein